MNKKRIFIPIVIVFILVIGFVLWKNRTVSIVTLEINPSIQINLKDNGKVKRVIALNEDAKEIVSNSLSGKTLDDTLSEITKLVVEKGYTDADQANVLVYTKGNIKNEDISTKLTNNFANNHVNANIIVIEKVTKADSTLAKKYDISAAKAAYINMVTEEQTNIDPKYLVDKSVRELNDTKATGNYCDEGYMLEGDFCIREKKQVAASNGKVCPVGYYEYQSECYAEEAAIETDKLVCRDEYKLDGTNCQREDIIEAEIVKYKCSAGSPKTRLELGLSSANDGDANEIICVDYSNATHPVTPCELPASDPTERMSAGGRCYWHRAPVIAEGCPGKIQVGGECWDDATNIYICAGYRDGKQYSSKDEYCEHSIKYLEPTVTEYKCPDTYTLDGNKCKKMLSEKANHEKVCPSGYTKVDNDRCIDKNKKIDKIDGFVCEMANARPKDNVCIVYETVEAKHN